MWWVFGITVYLVLLTLGILFIQGANKLKDPIQEPRELEVEHSRARASQAGVSLQLPLPFAPPHQPDLFYARISLAAVVINKISGMISHVLGS